MKVLSMALSELKMASRSKAAFALVLVLPVVMIFIMGNALAGAFDADKGIEKFQVLYVNEDKGQIGKAFDEFIKAGAENLLEPVSGDYGTAVQQVISGKYTNAIIVPKGLTDKIARGENANINVISSGNDKVHDDITSSIVSSFINYTITQLGIIKGYGEYLKGVDIKEVYQVLSRAPGNMGSSFVVSKDAGIEDAKKLTSFQFFTLSMLLYFLMTVGMGIGSSIVKDREDRMYQRISSYPVKPSEYLLAKVLSNLMLAVIQVTLVILFTWFAFNVDWGSNFPGIGITIVLIMFISSSIGLIFSSLASSSKTVEVGMSVVLWIIAFAGGGFMPVPALEPAGRFTFYKWALDSLVNFMGGGSFSSVSTNLLMLLALVVVLWIVGIMLYRGRISDE